MFVTTRPIQECGDPVAKLTNAVRKAEVTEVEKLIIQGVLVSQSDWIGDTPLKVATALTPHY
ncbi:MAG: hypothetical protein AAGG81_07805, partial [Chlamydiota bacterium]